MHVKVKLFTTLVKYGPDTAAGVPFDLELPAAADVADLLDRLKLPAVEVKIVFINGRNQPLDYQLKSGDEVGIFPAVGGG
jgi:molybdopterin converting factor small subunit